jgi:hypothetical protein
MIYKRGAVYWFKFVWKGKEIRKSTKQGNDKVARQIEAAYRTQLAKGEVGIEKKPEAPLFEKFTEEYLKVLAIEKASKPRTVRFYKDRVKQILKYERFKNIRLDKIDEDEIENYKAWRWKTTRKYALRKTGQIELADTFQPVGVATINRDLATLKVILRYARDKKRIELRVPRIPLIEGEENCERIITHTEEVPYLAQAPKLLREFATIMLDTGMRPGRGLLLVPVRNGANGAGSPEPVVVRFA